MKSKLVFLYVHSQSDVPNTSVFAYFCDGHKNNLRHDNFVVTLTNKWCFRPYFILNDLMAKFYCDPF